jgi:hypothetical protein
LERAVQSTAEVLSLGTPATGESRLFSTESVLKLQKLIFAGSPLSEVLTNIARLVESQGEGLFCTIWLPEEQGNYLYCAAAPSLPGFSAHVGHMEVSPKGASCTAANSRRNFQRRQFQDPWRYPCRAQGSPSARGRRQRRPSRVVRSQRHHRTLERPKISKHFGVS